MPGIRVMVVSEHPGTREVLCGVVETRGYEAYPAADGIDALRQIYQVLPRVIISDAALPNLAGFELLPFIRRRFPEIGVIALRDVNATPPAVVADVVLPVDSLNPELLGDVLSGIVKGYPFRMEEDDEDAERRSMRRLLTDDSQCRRCEQLQKEASLARMNSLLARVWMRLHPGQTDAERSEADADCALSAAVDELSKHQREEHGIPERKQPLRSGEKQQSYSASSC